MRSFVLEERNTARDRISSPSDEKPVFLIRYFDSFCFHLIYSRQCCRFQHVLFSISLHRALFYRLNFRIAREKMLQFYVKNNKIFAHARDRRANNTQFFSKQNTSVVFFALINRMCNFKNVYFFLKVNRIFVVNG